MLANHRIAALCAAFALSCSSAPDFPSVRDVRPVTLENGDTMVVELDRNTAGECSANADCSDARACSDAGYCVVALDPEAPTRVILRGVAKRPGEEDDDTFERTVRARVAGPARVLVDIDNAVEESIGGRVQLVPPADADGWRYGMVRVEQQLGNKWTAVARSGAHPEKLHLFRMTPRGMAVDLFGAREQEALLDWLGIEVERTDAGLQVTHVRGGFEGMAFLQRYDNGRWVVTGDGWRRKSGLDGVVHWAEAHSQGYDDAATFAWVAGIDADELDDGTAVTRRRIEAFLTENGVDPHEDAQLAAPPASAAGLAHGDVIVAADGEPTPTVDALFEAWSGDGATVAVTVVRDGELVRAPIAVARHGREPVVPTNFFFAIVVLLVGLQVILPIPVLGGLIVVWERKVSGRIQSRPGPNRVGPNGWLQWLADGVKLIVKEDIIPTDADPILFRISPLLVFTGVFLTFVVLPFSPLLQVADLNIGILYILSVTSIVVVGVIMGGWASNSKWTLLGGMRSAAQIISYELPASVAVLTIVVTVGSLSMHEIVTSQGGAPWNWNVFHNPFAFVCFFIFFISALAEGNRTPFDLPEAESELVSGYNTEYSGFRFSIFALAEWVNLIVIGAVTTTVFLGGWNIPFVDSLTVESSLWLQAAAFGVFVAKVMLIIFVCIWIRWTMPRFRVDHMMHMCWKYFLPISLVSLLGTAGWMLIIPADSIAQMIAQLVVFAFGGVAIGVVFIRKVLYAQRTTETWRLRGA